MAMIDTGNASRKVLLNGPLFGRLPKCGRSFLVKQGFQFLDKDDTVQKQEEQEPLRFIWPNKTGAQFSTENLGPALIRPYPTVVTEFLDDKILLQQLLLATNIMPESVHLPLNEDQEDDKLYFVKHRYGVQGKSVYVKNQTQLMQWYHACQNYTDFIIQREIVPTLDPTGRKFVLRGHVLMYHYRDCFYSMMHDKVICQTHAAPYHATTTATGPAPNEASHISQAGKHHPKPQPLEEVSREHPAKNSFSDIVKLCNIVIRHAKDYLSSSYNFNPEVKFFALLGLDILIDCNGALKLCEVNTHPALGWGSMKHVDYSIYEELIRDTLSILSNDDNEEQSHFETLV